MKRAIVFLVAFCAMPVFAGGHRHHRGCGHDGAVLIGPQGPQGIPGEPGPAGMDGADGAAGLNGVDGAAGATGNPGANGRDGDDALDATKVNVGAAVRWYDWEHVSLNSGYRYDTNHHGHTIDAMIVAFKIGDSYETRQLKSLQAQLNEQNKLIKQLAESRGVAPVAVAQTGEEPIRAKIQGSFQ